MPPACPRSPGGSGGVRSRRRGILGPLFIDSLSGPVPGGGLSRRRAIGLIGVVIGAAILAMLVPPIVGLFSGSYRTVTHSEASLMAALAANDLLERVADIRFVTHHAGETLRVPDESPPPGARPPLLTLMEPFATRYRAHAIVEIVRADGHTNPATGRREDGLFDVGVTMTWDEAGHAQELRTRTLVADLGPTKGF